MRILKLHSKHAPSLAIGPTSIRISISVWSSRKPTSYFWWKLAELSVCLIAATFVALMKPTTICGQDAVHAAPRPPHAGFHVGATCQICSDKSSLNAIQINKCQPCGWCGAKDTIVKVKSHSELDILGDTPASTTKKIIFKKLCVKILMSEKLKRSYIYFPQIYLIRKKIVSPCAGVFLRVHRPGAFDFVASKFGKGNILFVWQAVRDLQKGKTAKL